MTSIREIFSTFGPEYLQRYATTMPRGHRKVIDAMIACRTEACGIAFYQCGRAVLSCNSSSFPVAIATVPPASTTNPNSGSKPRSSANSQAITS
jgi:Transposase zinc-binding domain